MEIVTFNNKIVDISGQKFSQLIKWPIDFGYCDDFYHTELCISSSGELIGILYNKEIDDSLYKELIERPEFLHDYYFKYIWRELIEIKSSKLEWNYHIWKKGTEILPILEWVISNDRNYAYLYYDDLAEITK